MVYGIAILAIVGFGVWMATRKDKPSDVGTGGGSSRDKTQEK